MHDTTSLDAQCRSASLIVIHPVIDNAHWKAFGYKRCPRRGKLFDRFVKASKLKRETTLLRELWAAGFSVIFYWALWQIAFKHRVAFIAKLMEYCVDGTGSPLWPSLRFTSRGDAIQFLEHACRDYAGADQNDRGSLFLKRCIAAMKQQPPMEWIVGTAFLFAHGNSIVFRSSSAMSQAGIVETPNCDIKLNDPAFLSIADILFLQCRKNMPHGGMIFVDGGTFQMGSASGSSETQPIHAVTVNSLWLDATQVTVAQFRAFCAATGRPMPEAPEWGWADDNPIVKVNWEDATAYCQWAGKRLPTEAEWEFAARGGNRSRGFAYSGSNTLDSVAWYYVNSEHRTQRVGTKAPNELGLYDMSGNVWEWCSDWHDSHYYSVSPSRNPKGPLSGTARVLRGGSWFLDEFGCHVADRAKGEPTLIHYFFGFRCAADVE